MSLIPHNNHLGHWPQRLLHVPSLTSYEWRPGNIYGNTSCPIYNILTYTSGSYKILPHEFPSIPPLRINNIPWAVPRVHPHHFTPDQLLAALNQARGWSLSSQGFLVAKTDWVWVDFACVDQRKDSPAANAEMGRQREIFKGATRVFAWLTDTRSRYLDAFYETLTELKNPMIGISAMDWCYDILREILADPYFTSLWTLVEAALRPDAILLSRGAKLTPLQSPHPPTYSQALSIQHLADLSLNFLTPTSTLLSPSGAYIHNLLDHSGLKAIAMRNSTAVYIAALNRRCARSHDRFYAIQSLFNLRIGSTAPGFTHIPFTTDDLSVQFAEELLAHHPAMSQMFIHTAPTFANTGWGINNLSIFPSIPRRFCISFRTSHPSCELARLEMNGETWGWFKGYTCHFTTFYNRCMDNEIHFYRGRASFAVYLDATSETAHCLEDRNTADSVKQRRLLRWLKKAFPKNLVVLEIQSVGEVSFGLVLLKKSGRKFEHYRRVGICFWEGEEISMRAGYPGEWMYRESFLG